LLFHNPIYVGIYIATIWPIVLFTISKITGWTRLAEKYRTWEDPESNVMRAVRVNWGNIMITGNIYTIACNRTGLYLGVLFPFRLFHPPLLIPWHEIKTNRINGVMNKRVQLQLDKNLSRPFEIVESIAERIKLGSNGKFTY